MKNLGQTNAATNDSAAIINLTDIQEETPLSDVDAIALSLRQAQEATPSNSRATSTANARDGLTTNKTMMLKPPSPSKSGQQRAVSVSPPPARTSAPSTTNERGKTRMGMSAPLPLPSSPPPVPMETVVSGKRSLGCSLGTSELKAPGTIVSQPPPRPVRSNQTLIGGAAAELQPKARAIQTSTTNADSSSNANMPVTSASSRTMMGMPPALPSRNEALARSQAVARANENNPAFQQQFRTTSDALETDSASTVARLAAGATQWAMPTPVPGASDQEAQASQDDGLLPCDVDMSLFEGPEPTVCMSAEEFALLDAPHAPQTISGRKTAVSGDPRDYVFLAETEIQKIVSQYSADVHGAIRAVCKENPKWKVTQDLINSVLPLVQHQMAVQQQIAADRVERVAAAPPPMTNATMNVADGDILQSTPRSDSFVSVVDPDMLQEANPAVEDDDAPTRQRSSEEVAASAAAATPQKMSPKAAPRAPVKAPKAAVVASRADLHVVRTPASVRPPAGKPANRNMPFPPPSKAEADMRRQAASLPQQPAPLVALPQSAPPIKTTGSVAPPAPPPMPQTFAAAVIPPPAHAPQPVQRLPRLPISSDPSDNPKATRQNLNLTVMTSVAQAAPVAPTTAMTEAMPTSAAPAIIAPPPIQRPVPPVLRQPSNPSVRPVQPSKPSVVLPSTGSGALPGLVPPTEAREPSEFDQTVMYMREYFGQIGDIEKRRATSQEHAAKVMLAQGNHEILRQGLIYAETALMQEHVPDIVATLQNIQFGCSLGLGIVESTSIRTQVAEATRQGIAAGVAEAMQPVGKFLTRIGWTEQAGKRPMKAVFLIGLGVFALCAAMWHFYSELNAPIDQQRNVDKTAQLVHTAKSSQHQQPTKEEVKTANQNETTDQTTDRQ